MMIELRGGAVLAVNIALTIPLVTPSGIDGAAPGTRRRSH